MTPTDNRRINGRRRPIFSLHRSDKDPRIGHRKKPTKGDNAQTNVIC